MKNRSSEELMLLYASGNKQAFEELYSRFSGRIYAYFLSRVRSSDQSAELQQEFFKKIHINRTAFNPNYKLEPWLFTIAHNLMVSFFRKNKQKEVDLDRHANTLVASSNDEITFDLETLKKAMDKLPEQSRKIIELRYFQGHDFKKLSLEYGKSEVNIRKIISRSVKKLKGFLKNEEA